MFFLLEYDRPSGKLLSLREFHDDDMALASQECFELERRLLARHDAREVVLLQSESLDSLKITHKRYFATLEEILLGIAV